MTVQKILDFLSARFPLESACDFDNVGLLIGDPAAKVGKALVLLDCDLAAIDTAVSWGCSLIITHHPVIFDPLKNIFSGSVPYQLIKNNIAVISMHTNLDVGVGGVNDCLCDRLGLVNVASVPAQDGYLLRMGEIAPVTADDFAVRLKAKLGGAVKYVGAGKTIKKVLVCSGSGGNFLDEVRRFDCDALVTADVKHNYFLAAGDMDVALFDAGHFETENVVVEPLRELLANEFADVEWLSANCSKIKIV